MIATFRKLTWRFRPRVRIARRISRFQKNENGATAVEFAMVSVPFLGLLFAIFETAFMFFVTESLESAVADASRKVMTGQAQGTTYASAAAFRTAVLCPSVPSFITCSNLVIDVRTAGTGLSAFSSADMSKTFYTGATKYCMGSGGDVVVMRVVYPMPVYLSLLTAPAVGKVSTSTDGQVNFTDAGGQTGMKHILMASAAFRNEPFGTVTQTSGC